jgi:D-serine deaminase-like pyridoxal phosphate-dependent protein
VVSQRHGRSIDALRAWIGHPVQDLPTPALLLDLPAARHNIETMAERIAPLPATLRPHVKAHKSAELARLQLDAGATGVTTATVAEAEAMVDAGVTDVLIANQVVAPAWIERLVTVANRATITVAVDDLGNLEALGGAASSAGVELGVVVELDVGMGRGGARSVGEALGLMRAAAATDGIGLRGLMGYEGHCADEPEPDKRARDARTAMAILTDAASRARADGRSVAIVSAGATGTFEATGNVPGITEVQAGSYVVMDRFHADLVEGFRFAIGVASTVVSAHGDVVVVDAGRKGIGGDLRLPDAPGTVGALRFLHEEHAGFSCAGGAPLHVGDRVTLVPGYAPTTVNLFAAYHVVEDGEVVDVWPVLARHGES